MEETLRSIVVGQYRRIFRSSEFDVRGGVARRVSDSANILVVVSPWLTDPESFLAALIRTHKAASRGYVVALPMPFYCERYDGPEWFEYDVVDDDGMRENQKNTSNSLMRRLSLLARDMSQVQRSVHYVASVVERIVLTTQRTWTVRLFGHSQGGTIAAHAMAALSPLIAQHVATTCYQPAGFFSEMWPHDANMNIRIRTNPLPIEHGDLHGFAFPSTALVHTLCIIFTDGDHVAPKSLVRYLPRK